MLLPAPVPLWHFQPTGNSVDLPMWEAHDLSASESKRSVRFAFSGRCVPALRFAHRRVHDRGEAGALRVRGVGDDPVVPPRRMAVPGSDDASPVIRPPCV